MAGQDFQIPFDPTGLEAKTASALDDVVSSLQTQLNRKQQKHSGSATFDQPRCRLFRAAAQTLTTATLTPIVWDTIGHEHAPDNPIDGLQHDNGARFGATFRRASDQYLVPPIAGQYLIIGSVQFEADPGAAGQRQIRLAQTGRSGTLFYIALTNSAPAGALATQLQVSAIVTVREPGLYGFEDKFSLVAFQNSGGDLDANAGFFFTYVEMIKIS